MQISKPDSLRRALKTLAELRRQVLAADPAFAAKTDEEVLELMEKALLNASHEDLAYYAALMSYATSDPIMEMAIGEVLDEVTNEGSSSGENPTS